MNAANPRDTLNQPAAAPPGGGPGVPAVPNSPGLGTSPLGPGVLGRSNTGVGVRGESIGEGGGVVGGAHEVYFPPGDGVFGQGATGVHGVGTIGVHGVSDGGGEGVLGEGRNGVHGKSASATDSGVWGENTAGGYGVSGSTKSNYQQGASGTAGVWGNNSGTGSGVKGTSSGGDGVIGYSSGTDHAGVSAVNVGGGYGLWAQGSAGGKPAGHFAGDVEVIGKLTAGDVTGALVTCLNGLNTIGNSTFSGDISVKGDIALPGADCAEQFDIAADQELASGTVVVIDAGGNLRESQEPYDRKVAGVISGAGEYKPGILLDQRVSEHRRAPVALVGKVFCNVDAQYARIEVGDLLTTSPTPGHAMKAIEPQRIAGSIIGKALRGLDAGRGLIPILVSLQ